MWAYRAVFTQTDVGGGSILAKITANERMVILYGLIGQDDYAANRTLAASILDSAGNIIGNPCENTEMDNSRLAIPGSGEGAAFTVENANEFDKRIVMGAGETLAIQMTNVVQNETMTVAIRALIRSWPPTVTTTGSGGTVTTTVTYDKVI